MKKKIYVPDASIFAKLFHPEHDSEQAKQFFKTCAKENIKLAAPDIFRYELAEVTRYHGGSLSQTLDLIDAHLQLILVLSNPQRDVWLLAEKICRKGHEKSGFPSMYDSIYHALAIKLNTFFITADKKHYAKVKSYGHIKLLEDWESCFR